MKNLKNHCSRSTLSQWVFKKTSRHAQEYIKRYRLCMFINIIKSRNTLKKVGNLFWDCLRYAQEYIKGCRKSILESKKIVFFRIVINILVFYQMPSPKIQIYICHIFGQTQFVCIYIDHFPYHNHWQNQILLGYNHISCHILKQWEEVYQNIWCS